MTELLSHRCPNIYKFLFISSQYKRDMGILERIQCRDIKMFKGLEHLSCNKMLRELWVSSLKKSLKRGLFKLYEHMNGRCKENWNRLFLVVTSAKARSSDHKLEHRMFHLSWRTAAYFPQVIEPSFLEIFNRHQIMVLGMLLWVLLLDHCLNNIYRGPFQPQLSFDSIKYLSFDKSLRSVTPQYLNHLSHFKSSHWIMSSISWWFWWFYNGGFNHYNIPFKSKEEDSMVQCCCIINSNMWSM